MERAFWEDLELIRPTADTPWHWWDREEPWGRHGPHQTEWSVKCNSLLEKWQSPWSMSWNAISKRKWNTHILQRTLQDILVTGEVPDDWKRVCQEMLHVLKRHAVVGAESSWQAHSRLYLWSLKRRLTAYATIVLHINYSLYENFECLVIYNNQFMSPLLWKLELKTRMYQARIQKVLKGVSRRKILKEKCLLIHVSTRVHIKTRQTCNSFSFLPFQEDCLLFFLLCFITLFYFWNLKGGLQLPLLPL